MQIFYNKCHKLYGFGVECVFNLPVVRYGPGMSLLLQAADELKPPAGPEFRSVFLAYFEWGTLIKLYKLRYPRLHPDFWIRQSVLWLNDDLTFCGTFVSISDNYESDKGQ